MRAKIPVVPHAELLGGHANLYSRAQSAGERAPGVAEALAAPRRAEPCALAQCCPAAAVYERHHALHLSNLPARTHSHLECILVAVPPHTASSMAHHPQQASVWCAAAQGQTSTPAAKARVARVNRPTCCAVAGRCCASLRDDAQPGLGSGARPTLCKSARSTLRRCTLHPAAWRHRRCSTAWQGGSSFGSTLKVPLIGLPDHVQAKV